MRSGALPTIATVAIGLAILATLIWSEWQREARVAQSTVFEACMAANASQIRASFVVFGLKEQFESDVVIEPDTFHVRLSDALADLRAGLDQLDRALDVYAPDASNAFGTNFLDVGADALRLARWQNDIEATRMEAVSDLMFEANEVIVDACRASLP